MITTKEHIIIIASDMVKPLFSMDMGTDVITIPEGTWNPNGLRDAITGDLTGESHIYQDGDMLYPICRDQLVTTWDVSFSNFQFYLKNYLGDLTLDTIKSQYDQLLIMTAYLPDEAFPERYRLIQGYTKQLPGILVEHMDWVPEYLEAFEWDGFFIQTIRINEESANDGSLGDEINIQEDLVQIFNKLTA